ncbi:AAA domain-containing protein [Streptomyces polyrhachis]|uniref:AAA domain-containing protein n=1 Tax=Streptomyces polyrhachis TaxID=1282885 RepID=A0ABW2GP07_9ACTN
MVGQLRGERQRRARILRFWRAVEYFSPPNVDRVSPGKNVFAVQVGRPLPWEAGSQVSRGRPGPKSVWQHTVYAGIFPISKVRDILLEKFRAPEIERDFDGRTGGDSAMLCFIVNQDGRLIKDGVTLSSCAWAVGQTLDPGPHDDQWLVGFEQCSTHLLQRLLDLGDGKVEVECQPEVDEGSVASGLGPVGGLTSRLVTSAAKGGLGAAAAVVGAGLGPLAGAVTAKMIEQVGGDLLDAAATRLTGREQGGATPSSEAPRTGEGQERAEANEPPAEVGTKILDAHDLAAITRWVAAQLGIDDALTPATIRIKSLPVPIRRADEAPGGTFLNSFYADDLNQVADALEAGQAGTALVDYLRAEAELDRLPRVDVRCMPEAVLDSVQPSMMPAGRWLADVDQPLVLSQQFAVNRILATLGPDDGRGIYAVNGPPGTGKTTMLRDLIAALVVQRAERLATLERPEAAFGGKRLSWRTEETAGRKNERAFHALAPALTGFEIVIASSNNGAVENVTLEVPGARSIGEAWRSRADYLSGPAGLLLEGDAWGAIAARLGRRSNRTEFVERFWWTDPAKAAHSRGRPASGEHSSPGLHAMLKLQHDRRRMASSQSAGAADIEADDTTLPLGTESWKQAVQRFTRTRSRVRELADERQEIANLMAKLDGPDAVMDELLARETAAQGHALVAQEEQQRVEAALGAHREEERERSLAMVHARARLDHAEDKVREGEEGVRAAESALHVHDAGKPGRVRRLFAREALRRWEIERIPFQTALEMADAHLVSLEAARNTCRAQLRTAQREVAAAAATIRRAEAQVSAWRQAYQRQVATTVEAGAQVDRRRSARQAELQRVAEAEGRWGDRVPGREWRAPSDDRQAMEIRELSSPWMDPEFADARSELFLAALDLHRALLATAPDRVRKNLLAVMDVVKGQAPADLPADVVLAAWQVLFLIVPVMSTTFASLGRMFSQLGSEALGWLFVDEAGQAAPQEVVGALWRSRRAVVVGDPLQLEPVVTLPWKGQRRLAHHFDVDLDWAPGAASVQTLADRLNPFGTWLANEEGGDTWLGSPLRVHRRCDRLMFDISNKIAYDGMMVYGVDREQDDFPLVRGNVWIDVPALPGEQKWNPGEGRALQDVIDKIRKRTEREIAREIQSDTGDLPGDAAPRVGPRELDRRLSESLFVVSPFRDVVHGIDRAVGQRLTDRRYGTVHTTQGKEADIVILVLGTGAAQVGSRDWASKTPNLLNVAITRARRRLIVIGDFDAWSRHRYFKDLSQHDQIQRWRSERYCHLD